MKLAILVFFLLVARPGCAHLFQDEPSPAPESNVPREPRDLIIETTQESFENEPFPEGMAVGEDRACAKISGQLHLDKTSPTQITLPDGRVLSGAVELEAFTDGLIFVGVAHDEENKKYRIALDISTNPKRDYPELRSSDQKIDYLVAPGNECSLLIFSITHRSQDILS